MENYAKSINIQSISTVKQTSSTTKTHLKPCTESPVPNADEFQSPSLLENLIETSENPTDTNASSIDPIGFFIY